MHRILSTALLTLILCSLILSACGSARRTPQPTPPVTVTAASTASATAPIPTRKPNASQTPRMESTQISPDVTQEPTETPTATPFPAYTPEGGPEAYQLKPWDYRTAFRLFDEAESVSLAEEYEDMREFYQLSMLEEIFLMMPEYKTDPDLLMKKAGLKGLGKTYWETYGLLHDHSIEPFRAVLEHQLNSAGVLPSTANEWIEEYPGAYGKPITSNDLFDQPAASTIVKVMANGSWNFLIIRQNTQGQFSVYALYPEWIPSRWNDETFQITDLNANGRNEIAIEYMGWGTGMSHFCVSGLKVYEWDGSTFQNLFGDELLFGTDTGYSDCLPTTFLPDPNGGMMVQTGITYNTICPDTPYQKIFSSRLVGGLFQKQPNSTSRPPDPETPSPCTIDWLMDAGREDPNVAATMLKDVLSKWPNEAEQVWGPAIRDFLRLNLAGWYIELGLVEQGLSLLTDIRANPYTPEFPLASKLAGTFLSNYEDVGFYRAVTVMRDQYFDEQPCTYEGCNQEAMIKSWGVFDQDWEFSRPPDFFTSRFTSTGSLSWELNQKQPKSIEDLKNWLSHIGIETVWTAQSDLDGNSLEDWLVVITEKSEQYELYDTNLFAFLKRDDYLELIPLGSVQFDSNYPVDIPRWGILIPEVGEPLVNVIQIEDSLDLLHKYSR